MNSLSQSPRKSAKLIATVGIFLLPSLSLLAQPVRFIEQSPVNISRSSTVPISNPPTIDFNYGIVNVNLDNTYGKKDDIGRYLAREWGTLKATFPPGFSPQILVNGIPYDLIQFHFHVPAEHTVNGQRADMEVHFVHLAHNGGCASSTRPLVVLGAFINAGGNSNTELQKLFPPGLPTISGTTVPVSSVDLRALVPPGSPDWAYDGGLTAPADDCGTLWQTLSTQAVTGGFPEAVHWFIYSKALQLPKNLVDRFSALFPEGDARELKALV